MKRTGSCSKHVKIHEKHNQQPNKSFDFPFGCPSSSHACKRGGRKT
ncbi:hypothetical protein Patl1_05881 [Pistacia atlantica]|uniref:Uncharacterized protein n=1 Tax=Pistacia atlantica TaxID=434234 RepID=A0ACC1BUB6_9ROSI|nr:hypothetical protein Patl1_05881 [Pistacia atlantica]